MRFEDLQAQTLDQISTPEARAQARTLVQNNRVQYCYRMPDRLQGLVQTEQPFQVEVKVQNEHLSYVCSCPQVEGGEICPHVLALLWAWVEDPGRFLNREDLKEHLKKYAKRDLVEIVLELADRIPEARGVLKEEEQGLDEILESIDHIVEEVAADNMTASEAEINLRRAQTRADRLAQSGQLAEARAIYFYLLDNILALEEQVQRDHLFTPELKAELFEEYCQFIHEDRHLERELVQSELEQLESRARGELDLAEIKQEVSGAA